MKTHIITTYIIAFALTTTSSFVHAMLFHKLSKVEKSLVLREITKRGSQNIRTEIQNAAEPQLIEDEKRCGYRISTALKIEATFYKNEISTNPLARDIFAKIEKVEKKRGYIPDNVIEKSEHSVCVTMPTNFLGRDTRYYWLEDNGRRIPAVRINAYLTNKAELLTIVNNYNE